MYKPLLLAYVLGFSTIFAGSCSLVCEWKVGALSSETAFLQEIDKQQEEKFLSMFEKIQDSEFFLLSASRGGNCVGFLIVDHDKRKKQSRGVPGNKSSFDYSGLVKT